MYSILIQVLFNNKKHTFTEHSALIFIHGVNKWHYGFGVNRIHRRERINKLLFFLKLHIIYLFENPHTLFTNRLNTL